jgi:hypothetical protein
LETTLGRLEKALDQLETTLGEARKTRGLSEKTRFQQKLWLSRNKTRRFKFAAPLFENTGRGFHQHRRCG